MCSSQSYRASKATELAKTNHALDRLVQALIDGAPAPTVKDGMVELEDGKRKLENDLGSTPTPQPTLYPNMSDVNHSNVSDLSKAPQKPDMRSDAAGALRDLIDQVVLTPPEDGYDMFLRGYLADVLPSV